ncbi:MAG: triphosphoribosyl-dephospho-CoA synthase CitG [Clostridia bacterium]|nr:triphosphoribosyl-dephospho-CoA synthase CitG [Clostridia bacterium]
MDVTVQDMMIARERRFQKQQALLSEYQQTLLCFTMNIPGPQKDSPLIRAGMRLGRRLLEQGFLRLGVMPTHAEFEEAFTGCTAYYALPLPPLEVKRMTVDIEEAAPLGRLFDLDVLRPGGEKVDRQEVGFPCRKCLLCGQDARVCARSRTHTVEELRAETVRILREAILMDQSETVARLACQALLYEVLVTPKPGLVDRNHNGSHRDMDVFTFSASAASLYPYFRQCAQTGAETTQQPPREVFEKLRMLGRLAEGRMLKATAGVNTHRGAIFSLGLLCAAAGRLGREQWEPDALLSLCGEMAHGLAARDFGALNEKNARSNGQKLYLQYGVIGVRGEAEQGFPLVRNVGLPKLEAGLRCGLSLNDAGCAALLAIMARNMDTNVIHRSDLDTQKEVQAMADSLLQASPFPSREALSAFDAYLVERNISPGGSADLLTMCYLLYFFKEETV